MIDSINKALQNFPFPYSIKGNKLTTEGLTFEVTYFPHCNSFHVKRDTWQYFNHKDATLHGHLMFALRYLKF